MRNFQSAPYSLLEKLRYDQMFETLGAYDHHNEDLLYETSLQAQPSIWANNPASGLSSSLSLGGNSTTGNSPLPLFLHRLTPSFSQNWSWN